MDTKRTRRIQAVVGTLLYYARGADPVILPALNEISTEQAAPTLDTERKVGKVLDYAYTYQYATIRFHASKMILQVASDAAYLTIPGAKSRETGHYYLGNGTIDPNPPTLTTNGPINTLCKTIKNIMASMVEAEIGALFLNAKEAVSIRTALKKMGHPQPQLRTRPTTELHAESPPQPSGKIIESFRYAVALVTAPGSAAPIQRLLETRSTKSGRLLLKTPPNVVP